MATIRSVDEIVLNLIDFFKASLPELDTKPGSVARDLFIDAPASQMALIYDELGRQAGAQSVRLVSGSDLDKLAQNYGMMRKAASKATGVALLTFSSIPAVVSINSGALITASNGYTFKVQNGISVDPAQSNFYKSVATKYKNDLDFLGITDQYAIEVSVQASTPGTAGNISKYALNKTSIAGVSNATNVFSFSGGSNQETDAAFRNRVLAIFSGSNIGTSLGYKNIALSDSSVLDALVITPGSPLMTRDGTQVVQNSDGSFTVVSEGTGGKVDIIVLGSRTSTYTDTFVYRDQSNTGDPTNSANDFILGQISSDSGKTITQKRLDDISNGSLPAQPVGQLLEVTGTRSGANFKPKSVDQYGRVSGNYEFIQDTGNYGGSPWAFDKFHWVSNQISFSEDRIKQKFNGQDNTTFTDVLSIPSVQQNIAISNENSQVSSSDRSIIQLLHTPATNVTRVFNVNTGERYIIVDQNFDGNDSINTTGRIQISGNTLPASSDILQVDYTWIVDYDQYSDYDGKHNTNIRPVNDSIDWGYSNIVKNERTLFTLNSAGTFFVGNVKHPISTVVSANYFSSTSAAVSASVVPNFSNRLAVVLAGLSDPIDSISSIKLSLGGTEVYNTAQADGIILNSRVVVNLQIKYNCTIILPTDTSAKIGQAVEITYNSVDSFNQSNSTGSFSGNQITIPVGNAPASSQMYMDVSYIAALQDLFVAGISSFPISRIGNGYQFNSSVVPAGSKSSVVRKDNKTIQVNGSNQLYITLSVSSADYSMDGYSVVSVIDLNSNKEIWNKDFPGTLTTDNSGNYILIFSGFNSPAVGDNVLALYMADDTKKFQPFTFKNNVNNTSIQTLLFDFSNNNYYIPIHSFSVENNIQFQIIDKSTGNILSSGSDGYILSASGSNGDFSSLTVNFSLISDITGKSIRLLNTANANNSGVYSINSVNGYTVNIGLSSNNINTTNVSVVRIKDGKELWSKSCGVDYLNNKLTLPSTIVASQGDLVYLSLIDNIPLHQSPTKLSITVSDQVLNSGIITASGTTITKVSDVVFTAINDGLKQNALEAFKTFLQLSSNSTISKNNYIVRILKVEKVETTTNNVVLSTKATYDTEFSYVPDNILYSNEMLLNTSLQNTEFQLPATTNNINNAPSVGDKLRITFYYATDGDYENVYFTRNGTLYTNKKFALLDQLYVSSGFNSSQSARFTLSFFTQPASGSRYTVNYNYIAPKQDERILIQYNYNSLISDVTFNVENSRPINADVLVRAASQLLVDATINIVIKSDYINSAAIVLQNVKDVITSTINTNKLGDSLNSSDLIAAAQAVTGVDRVRIVYFNQTGKDGQVLTITCQQNQYFTANNVVINQETK